MHCLSVKPTSNNDKNCFIKIKKNGILKDSVSPFQLPDLLTIKKEIGRHLARRGTTVARQLLQGKQQISLQGKGTL